MECKYDNTSKGLLQTICSNLDDLLGEDIKIYDVQDQVTYTDLLVVCTARNSMHISSLIRRIVSEVKNNHDLNPNNIEGFRESAWVIIDYGFVLVHIFRQDAREFYQLDSLWKKHEYILQN